MATFCHPVDQICPLLSFHTWDTGAILDYKYSSVNYNMTFIINFSDSDMQDVRLEQLQGLI